MIYYYKNKNTPLSTTKLNRVSKVYKFQQGNKIPVDDPMAVIKKYASSDFSNRADLDLDIQPIETVKDNTNLLPKKTQIGDNKYIYDPLYKRVPKDFRFFESGRKNTYHKPIDVTLQPGGGGGGKTKKGLYYSDNATHSIKNLDKSLYDVEGKIGDDKELLDTYIHYMAEREYSANFDSDTASSFNKHGYIGPFQLGPSSLVDAGVMKKPPAYLNIDLNTLSGSKKKAFVMNSKNWKGGSEARDEFLVNPNKHLEYMLKFTKSNYKTFKQMLKNRDDLKFYETGINNDEELFGLLSFAHLKGVGSAMKYLEGRRDGGWIDGVFEDYGSTDANGMNPSEYLRGFLDFKNEGYYIDKKGDRVYNRMLSDFERNRLERGEYEFDVEKITNPVPGINIDRGFRP